MQTSFTKSITIANVILVCSSAACFGGFDSGILNFDYRYVNSGDVAYGPGPGVVGSASDAWNSDLVINTSPVSLVAADGSPTDVVWDTAGGGGGTMSGIDGTYGKLFDAWSYITSARITGLTENQQYTLYLSSVVWAQVIAVNGVEFSTPAHGRGTWDSLTLGIDYDVHTVTADADGTLAFEPRWAQYDQNFITSWQLTPVPEPTTLSLLGLGSLALVMGRRRIRPVARLGHYLHLVSSVIPPPPRG